MAERQPLLGDAENGMSDHPPGYTEADVNKSRDTAEPPSMGQDELPPPYTPNIQSLDTQSTLHTHVNCKVCQAVINLEGRSHLYVVNCSACNEATPIKHAPPGKKYIRCPCNCLLMCSIGAVRVACPRDNCRRMMGLQPRMTQFTSDAGATVRARCCHCNQILVFLKQDVKHKLAVCPHCHQRSAVGRDYIKRKVLLFTLVGLFFLLLGVTTTLVAVYTYDGVGVYVVYIGAYLVGVLNILRALLFCRVNVSEVL